MEVDYPLSESDINKKLKGRVRIYSYVDLHKYDNIKQLLYPYNCCIILIEQKRHNGHWICVMSRGTTIEVFNSYGTYKIDEELKMIDPKFRKESNQDNGYLSKLLYESNKRIEYNDNKFQKGNSTTCGRWCVLRLLFKDYTIEQFYELFKDVTDKDIVKMI